MKYIKLSSIVWPFLLLCIFYKPATVSAQLNDIGRLLQAGTEDAEILAEAYLEPLINGVSANLNTGWFNSASAHQPLGFSIQLKGTLAFVPSSGRQFDINSLPLNTVSAADPSNSISPTIGGNDEIGPEVVVEDDGEEVARFNLPRGSGIHAVPLPMLQASVGLIVNTDVIVRFVPEVEIGDYGNFQMLGIGLKHELTQYIPADALFPVDISIMAGYSNIDISAALDLNPQPGAEPDPNYNGDYSNQKIETSFDTFTAKLIVGKSLPFISIFGALGYQTSSMVGTMLGDYPVPIAGPDETTKTTTVTDPFSYSQNGENEFSLTAGITFKLSFFNIYGSYTLADYPALNAGIGFSFR